MVLKPRQRSPSARPDLVWLDGSKRQLPFLRNVHLTMLKPSQFGLDKWTRTFVIPDNWMRKIYKDEVYHDSDLPKKETESFSAKQKKIIYDWLTHESPIRLENIEPTKSRRSRHKYSPSTDLIKILNSAEEPDVDSEDLEDERSLDECKDSEEYDERGIPLLIEHKYQPGPMIVRKAMQNMTRLTREQDDKIRYIMKDPELMKMLHKQVSQHLGRSTDGYSI